MEAFRFLISRCCRPGEPVATASNSPRPRVGTYLMLTDAIPQDSSTPRPQQIINANPSDLSVSRFPSHRHRVGSPAPIFSPPLNLLPLLDRGKMSPATC